MDRMVVEIDVGEMEEKDARAFITVLKILDKKGYKIVPKDALVLENELTEYLEKKEDGLSK